MSIRAAALKLNINLHAAQGWIPKKNKDIQKYIQSPPGSGISVGRPPVLTDDHKKYMIQWAVENADSVVLQDILDFLHEKLG